MRIRILMILCPCLSRAGDKRWTPSGDRKIPVAASKGEAAWIDEEGAFTESDDTFSQISIGAYKVGTMIKVSDELLNDSAFNLEAYISKEFGRRIGPRRRKPFLLETERASLREFSTHQVGRRTELPPLRLTFLSRM